MIIDQAPGIRWIPVVSIPFTVSITFHFLLALGVVAYFIGEKGFYGHLTLLSWLIIIYPILILFSAALVASWVKKRKYAHFFISLSISIVINLIMVGMADMYSINKQQKLTQVMYENEPQSRALLDPQRPLTIASPLIQKRNAVSPLNIIVYAVDGVLDEKGSIAEVRADAFKNSERWGMGILKSNGELAPDGKRVIYYSTIEFSPPMGWEEALVIIRGSNGEFEFITLYP